MGEGIPFRCTVSLSVWQKFKNRRNRFSFSILWHPDPGCQSHAVSKRNECILNFAHIPWKFVNNLQFARIHSFLAPQKGSALSDAEILFNR
ncbi:MAG: hypothetical protein V1246_06080, partial [Arenicellales bacterium]|nr:hypothetical protein [Arenicellales bacterium]